MGYVHIEVMAMTPKVIYLFIHLFIALHFVYCNYSSIRPDLSLSLSGIFNLIPTRRLSCRCLSRVKPPFPVGLISQGHPD